MTTESDTMVKFNFYVTKEQYAFLKRVAQQEGITAGHALRKGLTLYAKKHDGTVLEAGPGGFK